MWKSVCDLNVVLGEASVRDSVDGVTMLIAYDNDIGVYGKIFLQKKSSLKIAKHCQTTVELFTSS